MKIVGYDLKNGPFYHHDCFKCKFINSIVILGEDKEEKKIDVYLSCDGSIRSNAGTYLIRYGNKPHDFINTNIEELVAVAVSFMIL